jgi:hypothetical protein
MDYSFKNPDPSHRKVGQDQLVTTKTGEPFMPARVCFRILNKKEFFNSLNKLKCVQWKGDNHFNISYGQEAKNLELPLPYNISASPILLAQGYMVSDTVFHMDLESVERAVEIVGFLSKHINKNILQVSYAAIYNQLSGMPKEDQNQGAPLSHNVIFSPEKMVAFDLAAMTKKITDLFEEDEDEEAFLMRVEELKKATLPLVQKIIVPEEEEGLETLYASLMMSRIVAEEQWNGNTECTPFKIFSDFLDEDEDDEDYEDDEDDYEDEEDDYEDEDEDEELKVSQ